MEDDKTTVRIIVCKPHEQAFLEFLGRPPDDRDYLAYPDFVDLMFDDWDHPNCTHFSCRGIPFLGYHDHGDSYGPHRMCGDGDTCMEICADRDERLYILINDITGLSDWESSDVVHGYLYFENECRERMGLAQPQGYSKESGRVFRIQQA